MKSISKSASDLSALLVKWFQCFVTDGKYSIDDTTQKEAYLALIDEWMKCMDCSNKFLNMLPKTDLLLNSFEAATPDINQEKFCVTVVQHLVRRCFKHNDFFGILRLINVNVENERFINEFKIHFEKEVLDKFKSDDLKELNSDRNPLCQLMKIGEGDKPLLAALIEATANKIDITEEDIFKDVFEVPSKSNLIYSILFKSCFRTLPIHRNTKQQMSNLWTMWEEQGLRFAYINAWRNQKNEQKRVAVDMWDFIKNETRREYSFSTTLDDTINKLDDERHMCDIILSCIEEYCEHAADKENLIREIGEILQSRAERIKPPIIILSKITELHKYASKLILSLPSKLHQDFLKQIQDKFTVSTSSANTCASILEVAAKESDVFINQIKNKCSDWHHRSISELADSFPNKQNDFTYLSEHLSPDVSQSFEKLFDYIEKNTTYRSICEGVLNLCKLHELHIDDTIKHVQAMLSINPATNGTDFLLNYRNFLDNCVINFSEEVKTLLFHYGASFELIEFLYNHSVYDIDNLRVAVCDWDDISISRTVINDLMQVKTFLDRIDDNVKKISGCKLPLHKLLQHIDVFSTCLCKDEKYKSIFGCIISCNHDLLNIKHIHLNLTNRGESKRQKMSKIVQQTSFSFIKLPRTISKKLYELEYHYDVTVKFNELSDLRDRARLIEYSNRIKPSDSARDIEMVSSFVSFVDTIENIIRYMTFLNVINYPSIPSCLEPKTYACVDGRFQELVNFEQEIKTTYENWEHHLYEAYEKCVSLSYFFYQQLWCIEHYLRERALNDRNAYHLLKYIGIEPESIQHNHCIDTSGDPISRLHTIVQILLSGIALPPQAEEKSDLRNSRVLVVQTPEEGIMRGILSIFKFAKSSAAANQLFYCTNRTNWVQVRAFAYRCFYSGKFHLLIRPELLQSSVQNKFTEFIDQMLHRKPDHHFQFGIITTSLLKDQPLISSLQGLELVYHLYDYEMLDEDGLENEIKLTNTSNCFCFKSSISGVGKTTCIRKQINDSGKKYILFSISGNLEMETLARRFRKCIDEIGLSEVAIHIDIGIVDDIHQLNEFLYSIIMFRSFRHESVAINIPTDMPIYIELDSSQQMHDQDNKIVLLKYLTTTDISLRDWNVIDIKYLPGADFVAHYFQTINSNRINTTEITEQNIPEIDHNICITLLKELFSHKNDGTDICLTRIKILVTIYYYLFSNFSKCIYFRPQFTVRSRLRQDILEHLLQSRDQFVPWAAESIRKSQRSITNVDNSNDTLIRWDKMHLFTVIFTSSNDPLFIYKKTSDVPRSLVDAVIVPVKKTFKGQLSSLFSRLSGRNIEEEHREREQRRLFPDYSELKHADFLMRLLTLSATFFTKPLCNTCFNHHDGQTNTFLKCENTSQFVRPEQLNDVNIMDFLVRKAGEMERRYIWTADNYVKALLIYLRIECHLPVILVGEAGCGKTSLIRCLCQEILCDELAVFQVHAGVTNETVLEKMREYQDKATKCAEEDKTKRLWVFFDEFNTTSCVGLFKEIMCERKLFGESLPDNMRFLAACNPQRWRDRKSFENVGLRKDQYEIQRLNARLDRKSLIYRVVPIPDAMLEYVWDYGFIDGETERAYIGAMLNRCNHLKEHDSWFRLMVDLIATSQKFFRENEDSSSVSLRDVARFCMIYNWFLKSREKRTGDITDMNKIDIIRDSSLIALLLTYYLRIHRYEFRQPFLKDIGEKLKDHVRSEKNVPDFLNGLLRKEQEEFIETAGLPPGIAQNRALMDNMFVLFVCIFNKIPVILCGKPGSSKTLAVNTILNMFKGERSSHESNKGFPELFPVSYQGTEYCTSESVKKLFERAEKQKDSQNNILPLIIFDEIGLAELSPHNPLKVLHSELEVETCEYGFVGISNWSLDAAKMNRVLYLACADPTKDDLKTTAKTIALSSLENSNPNSSWVVKIVENLAVAYFELTQRKQQEQLEFRHYFGLRDFYSLIKGVVNDLKQESEKLKWSIIVRQQIEINFDEHRAGSQFLWERFWIHCRIYNMKQQARPPTLIQMVDQSLSLRSGRYLMLIAENESFFDYVERYISSKQLSTRTLIGSSLPNDLISGTTYSEQYNRRVLMDVILYAERSVTLIMRRLDHVYANLYDLFNQSFDISGLKRYCRISLGTFYHPRFLIHKDFFCVVLVRQKDLPKSDLPFLNRFEKHFITKEKLLCRTHQKIVSNICRWINNILSNTPKEFALHEKHLFVDYNEDYICLLVLYAFDHFKFSEDTSDEENNKVVQYCKEKLIHTSSLDLPLVLSLTMERDTDNSSVIEQYYQIHSQLLFKPLLDNALGESTIPNRVIYTYTQIYEKLEYLDSNSMVVEIKIGHFKTEFELRRRISEHYRSTNARLLLIRVDYHSEQRHVLFLKHITLNERISTSNHGVWLIFHLQRHIMNGIEGDALFNGWSPIMIDDLNENKIVPKDVLTCPDYSQLMQHRFYSISHAAFNELIVKCFLRVRYTVTNNNKTYFINERRDSVIKLLTDGNTDKESLHMIVKNRLSELIRTFNINHTCSEFIDWRHDLLRNKTIMGSCPSINSALNKTLLLFYGNYFIWLLDVMEKSCLLDSYRFLIENKNDENYENLKNIWLECVKLSFQSMENTMTVMDVIEVPIVFDLHLPRAQTECEIIRQIYKEIRNSDEYINEQLSIEELVKSAIEKLLGESAYGENIQIILNTPALFSHYYRDQLVLLLDQARIYDLSVSFVERLLTSNPLLSTEDKLKHLLIYQDELIELLYLFHVGMKIVGEDKWNSLKQLYDSDAGQMTNLSPTNVYVLVLKDNKFYQAKPHQLPDEIPFECNGDPFIETSLLNLIELLVSSSAIDRIDDIAQLSTAYSLVIQSVFALNCYSVDNLEKLRSLNSLVRCIMDLLPNEKALDVFKQVRSSKANDLNYDGYFDTCDTILAFTNRLGQIIKRTDKLFDSQTCRSLLKLETEFLRNWLIDHGEDYCIVLDYICKSTRNLWFYSATIFNYIDKKLKLMEIFREQINELESIKELEKLDTYIRQLDDGTQKIERIMINCINIYFMSSITNDQMITEYVKQHYNQFQNYVYNEKPDGRGLSKIFSIAWLRVYLQMYAWSWMNDNHDSVMDDIDEVLTNNTTNFCLTLKLFIVKQLCIFYHSLEKLHDVLVNRECQWLRGFFTQYNFLREQNLRKIVIFPRPLFEAVNVYHSINQKIEKAKYNQILKLEWTRLLAMCSKDQFSFYCFFINYLNLYEQFHHSDSTTNKPLEKLLVMNQAELEKHFEPIGYQLLLYLCKNFRDKSYYQLQDGMSVDEVHKRLVALNIVIVFLSYKAIGKVTNFSKFLFDKNLRMANNYTEHFQNNVRPLLPDMDDLIEINAKPFNELSEDLDKVISTRFIRMTIYAILLFLNECKLLDNQKLLNSDQCQRRFETEYESLRELSAEPDECYIWLFKLLNHMVDNDFVQCIPINEQEKYINFEEFIRQRLIIPYMESISGEIKEYKLAYRRFLGVNDDHSILHDLVDELVEDENKYPLLNLFTISNIYSVNPIESFYNKLRRTPNVRELYPIALFILGRFDDFSNIQYLYPIAAFANYLIKKFNYRITRKDAAKKTIRDILFNDADRSKTSELYKAFIDAWYGISLKEFSLGSQNITFERMSPSKEFAEKTEIAKILLNSSKGSQSLLLMACLKTIGQLQNEIVNYYHKKMNVLQMKRRIQSYQIPLQSVQPKQLFCFDRDSINEAIISNASVINYNYGKGNDIIYDYEEIEFMLRDKICALPLIDIENLQFMSYQFELYDENTSLITDVRKCVHQSRLDPRKRSEVQNLINGISNDELLQYLGSVDYIFTHLRHSKNNNIKDVSIKSFMDQNIHAKTGLSDSFLREPMLSTINIECIVDFYESMEEIVFDKIFRNSIQSNPNEATRFSGRPIERFIEMTLGNNKIANSLKNIDDWINMLKRLHVRVSMSLNLSSEVPLQRYVVRLDLWTVNVTAEDVETLKIDGDILFRHAYNILKELENKRDNSRRAQKLDDRKPIFLFGSSIFNEEAPSSNPANATGVHQTSRSNPVTKKLR